MVKANSNLKNKIRTLLGKTDLDVHNIDESLIESIIGEVEQFKIESKIEGRADQFFYDNSLDMHCIAGFDGYFKTLNPRWEQYLGWSTQEMLSKPWIEFVHPDDKESTQNIKSTIVDGKDVYHFENRYICKDGSVKWLSWNSHPDTEKRLCMALFVILQN